MTVPPKAPAATLFDAAANLPQTPARRFRPYPQYRPSGVSWLGEVPSHWQAKRVKYVATLINHKVDADAAVRCVGLEHVEPWTGKLIESSDDEQPNAESVANLFESGDVLFGKLRPYLAKVVHARDSGCCTSELLVLRGRDLQPRFLFYYALNRGFIETVDGSTFGSKMPRADWQFIGNMIALIPPPDEQQAIAAFLDRETAKIDSLVAKKRRLIELLREKRTALISRAVTKGLNPAAPMKPSGIDWLGDVPKHWESKRLRFLGEALLGLTYEPTDVTEPGAGTLVLRSSNIAEGRIVLDDNVYVTTAIPPEIRTRVGDILICSRNGSRALIGKCARIDESAAGVTFGAFMTVFRSPASAYIFYVLNSAVFDYQSGAFLTATINQLTLSSLKNMEVPIPPPDEQAQIVAFLEKQTALLDRLKERIHEAVNRLLEYRSALISAAVTGKIDVRGEVRA